MSTHLYGLLTLSARFGVQSAIDLEAVAVVVCLQHGWPSGRNTLPLTVRSRRVATHVRRVSTVLWAATPSPPSFEQSLCPH